MLKKLGVGLLILAATSFMAMISYSFITTSLMGDRTLMIFEGQGVFWELGKEALSDEASPTLGYVAPDFALADLSEQNVQLSDLRGKPTLINFWATWCPPCRTELPDIEDFYQRHGDQIHVLGVNWSEDRQLVADFLEKRGVTFPNLLDLQGKAFVAYRLTGVPSTFFIDEYGIIRGAWLGPLKSDEIASQFVKITNAFDP